MTLAFEVEVIQAAAPQANSRISQSRMAGKLEFMEDPALRVSEQLLAKCKNHAERLLHQSGLVTPAVFGLALNEEFTLVLAQMDDVRTVNEFATLARVACIANHAIGAALVAQIRIGKSLDDDPAQKAAAKCLARKDYVLVHIETVYGTVSQKLHRVVHTAVGAFLGQEESEVPFLDAFQGRFTKFLAPGTPSQIRRELSQIYLDMVGPTIPCIRITKSKR